MYQFLRKAAPGMNAESDILREKLPMYGLEPMSQVWIDEHGQHWVR